MKPDPNIDRYLAALQGDKRASLEQLRADIRAAAPDAEECISYGVPAFKQDGGLVSFGAAKNHCSFFVQSPAVLESFAGELGGYSKAKGTIHFKPGESLPRELVARIVAARLAENQALRANKKSRAKAR
jgi:uncharacterized protein YdhG (YjbR/CyaY superfamily)